MKKILLLIVLGTLLVISMTAQSCEWAKRMGYYDPDGAFGIAIDAFSHVYVTGYFQGTVDFDPSDNTANLVSHGGKDIFIARYDTLGNYIWSIGLGDAYGDAGASITTDASGNVYATGSFYGTVDFDPSENTANVTGGYSSYVAKYNSSGSYLWAIALIGEYHAGTSIATDTMDNVYVTGYFQGAADFDPSENTAILNSVGGNDAYIAKYDSNGNYLWATNIGGQIGDYGYDIATDALGNVFITGGFQSVADFDPSENTATLTSNGFYDIYVAKYNASTGDFIWATGIGGYGITNDMGNALTTDTDGNVYVTGRFGGEVDFDPSDGIANLSSNGTTGNADVFVAKYDTSGNYIWAHNFGGVGSDAAKSILTDANGILYISGSFLGTSDFDPSENTVSLTSSYSDIFIAAYDADGNYIWAKKAGGADDDIAESIALDVYGNVYLTGLFGLTADFDPNSAIDNLISAGSSDVFIAKYNQVPTIIPELSDKQNAILMYPNPTIDHIKFSSTTNVCLKSLQGQLILCKQNTSFCDLSSLPAGIYIATFTDAKGQTLQRSRIVKE